LEEVLNRAGGLDPGNILTREQLFGSQKDTLMHPGNRIDVLTDENRARILVTEMPSYYKITLGLPLSLNRESLQGLTAVPGIGHKTAEAIVSHRDRVGGFKRVEEILSVSGIGPNLYHKIRPYLDL
jgi:competence protein ComEA